MKKTLQFLFFSALSVGAVAQQKANIKQTEGPKALQEVGPANKIDRSKQFPVLTGNRDVIFYETFENGFNGSTPLGPWTYSHAVTGVPSTQGNMWSIGDPTYENEYGGPGDALVSASPDNWALWDGAAYCEAFPVECNAAGTFYSGYLTSPVINCSELPSVLVSFQQVFRYCCLPTSPVSLDVSVDGGTSWTSFNALGTAVEGANVASPNPLNTVIDISCVAAGEEEVLLRFSYNSAEEDGYTHYYWGIDEVKVYDNTNENDLFISELYCGDVINDWEFRVTPEEEIRPDGMIVGARIGNKGTADHDDVVMHFELLDADGEVVEEYFSDPFLLYGALNDTVCPHLENTIVLFQTEMVPTVGTYTLRATIQSGAEEDETAAADNTMSEVIVFNNIGEFGHDPDTNDGFQYQIGSRFVSGSSGPRDPGGWGSHYSFINPNTEAHGITVRFGSNTVAGVEFKAVLIKQPDATSLDNGTIAASGDYETNNNWLANHGGEPLYFAYNGLFPVGGVFPAEPFTNPEIFQETGTNYVAAIWRQQQGIGQLSVLAAETIDADLSSVAWERGGDQNHHWFHFQEFDYAVRLITKAGNHIPVSVEEVNNTASFSVYPNPAVTETRVAFDLAESKFVAYEVRDLQGRLMDTDNVGRFGAGQNSFSLNVSKYPAGNYIVGLVLDGKQIITQQFSVVK